MMMKDLFCGDEADGLQQGLVIFIMVIGAYKLLMFTLRQIYACMTYCCRTKQDLLRKYGGNASADGSYAVVTGGSEGLGLEMCNQLAEQGFNICMISRNKTKIDQKIGELRLKHPLIKLKGVAADLSTKTSVAEYKDLVASELAELDIGVLCLNAGCWVQGPTDLVSDSDFERTFGLNGLHVVYLIKALLPKQLLREQKSSILVTSSVIANTSMPGLASYSATKAMVSNFTQALHFEVRNKIDVTCWEPGPCTTNLFADQVEGPPEIICLTPQKAVRDVLCQLGKARVTNGSFWFRFTEFPQPFGIIGNKVADNFRT